jgi:hypothetical protein
VRTPTEVAAMRNAALLLCLLALGACSNKPPAPKSASKAAAPSAPWDAMAQDEQRARDVQKLVDKHAAEQDRQIEQQTQ